MSADESLVTDLVTVPLVGIISTRQIVVSGLREMLRQHGQLVQVLDPDSDLDQAHVVICDVSGSDRVASTVDRIVGQRGRSVVALTSTGPLTRSAAAVLRRRVACVVDMDVSSDELIRALEAAARTPIHLPRDEPTA